MRAIATGLLALFAGCVDSFEGSNVQFDFAPGMPVLASPGATPRAGELPANTHFTLYAFEKDDMAGRLFEIQRFEIHRIVDVASPCFIDVGEHVPHPGLHVSKFADVIALDTGIPDYTNPPPNATEQQKIDIATAVQRMTNIAALGGDAGIRVVSSASSGNYPPVAASCADSSGIPPPDCIDEVSNQRRLAMCQQAWHDDPLYFEGTDRVLTVPLNGITNGLVDGMNPVNLAPVGGAQMFVDEVLDGFAGFAIYTQADDQQTPGGDLLMFGKPTMPTRGVIHVHMTNAASPTISADLAIFSNLSEDDVSF